LLAVVAVVLAAGAMVARAADEVAKVGDEVKLGDWTVKVFSVQDPQKPANEFFKPAKGNRWVGVDAEVKNLSKDPANVSSLLCFKVKDSANREYSEAIMTGITPGPPEGEVDAGGAKRGTLVFEVPQDATGLEFRFKCAAFSPGTARVRLR
jgi:hypothetical protein